MSASRFARQLTGPEAPRRIRRSFTVNTTTAGNPLFSHPQADHATDGFAAESPGATYEDLFREPGAERELPAQRR